MTKPLERELDLLLTAVTDPVFVMTKEQGTELRIKYANAAFVKATGCKNEMVEGCLLQEVLPLQTAETILLKIKEVGVQVKEMQWQQNIHFATGTRTAIIKIVGDCNADGVCTTIAGSWHDITDLMQEQQEKRRVEHLLHERVKELSTLHRADLILQSDTQPQEMLLEELVNILPAGWQYPAITEARIIFNGEQFCTKDFFATVDRISADIVLLDSCIGIIEVGYREEMPPAHEGPFLKEERTLIDMLAEKLKLFAGRRVYATQLFNEKELSDSVINNLPGIFYIFDKEGNRLRWNRNLETVSGYSHEDLKHLHPLDFFDGKEREFVATKIQQVYDGRYVEVEADLITKSGERIPYFLNGVPIFYKGQHCVMGFGVDISERRKSELELKEAELKFRTLVEKSQAGVYILSEGKIVYFNQRFAEIFGYTIDELMGLPVLETLVAPESRLAAKKYAYTCLQGRDEQMRFELWGVKKDGSINRIEFYVGRTVFNGKRALIGTVLDITERKMWEETLQRSEANLQSILGTTDTCYVLLDKALKIQSFNHKALEYLQREFKKAPVLQLHILEIFPPERHATLAGQMDEVLSGKQVNYEVSHRQPDESYNRYLIKMFPVSDDEQIFGLMMAVSDITEMRSLQQKMLEQSVEEQKKIARAILRAQEQERAWIGRELHDNVNQILVSSKMMLGLMETADKQNRELITRAKGLVDNAINEIRVLTHEELVPSARNDLKALIRSLLENLDRVAGLQVNFTYDDAVSVTDDELQVNIYRIIQELFNNILKHAAATKVSLSVISYLQGVKICVQDNGRGFNPANPSKGIGLNNIVNRVKSFNGTFSIDTIPAGGCRMEFIFPGAGRS
ncbi:PAS domain S-box protein [Danxiaibacter flavus]|uniref:histidine kinase n=1 Tax=Danxiaibacter flavus TaxID=3049108 RepID=A0ABV3ZJ41_9BACT|nr:PAS domain S-box protein [Chitinophagaceae bacterium DXS]